MKKYKLPENTKEIIIDAIGQPYVEVRRLVKFAKKWFVKTEIIKLKKVKK